MRNPRKPILVAALSVGLLLSAAAQAEPKLVSSTPADGSTVEAPAKVELRFSEKLQAQHSGAKIIMTEMAGMAHAEPMGVKARVSASSDPNVMLITPASPLTSGTYRIDWRAGGAEGQPAKGAVTFKVK
ncbi:copper homeostasis periplasmic binding protein CopC [Pseudomonas panipatensis]|jgi:methionine-rich copper-binding protein CopC|uniref:CopC domain-containing protein n=1 Tax=Pseudomonas panipatensis TaxID=428992 RepID=A0A1G8BGG7_9PSED|nr:copper homeostasis periplasmic binding protein CopC [Pseudomonas panipatensis]SDH31680.1 hypothetical protein SAMN05216272_10130 [Pseudomonas panipatensis]SMP71012.1 hypothetical protein SAMN06295951_11010 [Pseudomonas panipatensis]